MTDAVNPDHYKSYPCHCKHCGKQIEPIDFMAALPGPLYVAVKYMIRLGKKDDEVQELRKAIRYIESYIEYLGREPLAGEQRRGQVESKLKVDIINTTSPETIIEEAWKLGVDLSDNAFGPIHRSAFGVINGPKLWKDLLREGITPMSWRMKVAEAANLLHMEKAHKDLTKPKEHDTMKD